MQHSWNLTFKIAYYLVKKYLFKVLNAHCCAKCA